MARGDASRRGSSQPGVQPGPRIKPGVERTRRLLDQVGAPDRAIPRIVQVAGTNGKGSTAALLEAILRAAGRRTALFTSPPLDGPDGPGPDDPRPNGSAPDGLDGSAPDGPDARVPDAPAPDGPCACAPNAPAASLCLAGRPVSRRRLRELLRRVDEGVAASLSADPPTDFERFTAAAVLAAAAAQVDVLILEAGLGGRLDATSAVARVDLSLLTPIDLDHRQWLGPTIEAIAREKAGIIRPGVPVVTSASGPALAIILAAARERGAPVYRLGADFTVKNVQATLTGTRFDLRLAGRDPWPLTCGLLGPHQATNAATAAAAALALGTDPAAVARGLAAARWPGRCELVARRPCVLLDGAHNAAGMKALRRAVDELFPGADVVLVCGMLADKDAPAAAAAWRDRAARVLAVAPPNPRALPPGELAAAFRSAGVGPVEVAADWQEGLGRGLAEVEQRAGTVLCVCGSLFLVGPARRLLRRLLRTAGRTREVSRREGDRP